MYAEIMGRDENNQHQNWILLAWIVVILAAVLAVLIAFPFMHRAYQESQVGKLIQQYRASQHDRSSETVQATVYFLVPDRQAQPKLKPFSAAVSSPSYHAAIEALLQGPPAEALREGAISGIPPDTRLLGLTVSYQIAYVDVSPEFANPTVWDPDGHTWKTAQITETLVAYPGIRDVIILVDGKILRQPEL